MGDAIVADITVEAGEGGGRRKQVVFHVTGFGKFQGVSSNPTERLMRHLERELKRGKWKSSSPSPSSSSSTASSYVIASVDVVEVSADAAKLYMEKLNFEMDKKKRKKGKEIDKTFCFLHFGVTGDIDKSLTLETTGWNDASFRVADERGWQPNLQPILSQFPLGHALKTSLPLSEVSKDLQTLSISSKLSIDPGRFLCNYIYFLSLYHAQQLQSQGRNVHSLFVHVPPATSMSKKELRANALALFSVIGSKLSSSSL